MFLRQVDVQKWPEYSGHFFAGIGHLSTSCPPGRNCLPVSRIFAGVRSKKIQREETGMVVCRGFVADSGLFQLSLPYPAAAV